MTSVLAGVLLGLAGSAHCAGMCGPLVLTIGLASPKRAQGQAREARGRVESIRVRLAPLLAYHAGRMLIYLVLAAAAGLAGHALSFAGLGRAVSVASGVVLLTVAAGSGPHIPRRPGLFWSVRLTRVCAFANRSTRFHPISGQVVTGMVNGLLPCGLVYAAAIAAAGLGSVSAAVVFMAGFALGTVPALLAISLSASSLPASLRERLRRLTPVALALTGTLLIARGLLPFDHVGHRYTPVSAAHPH